MFLQLIGYHKFIIDCLQFYVPEIRIDDLLDLIAMAAPIITNKSTPPHIIRMYMGLKPPKILLMICKY